MSEILEGYPLSPQQRRLWRLAAGDFDPYRSECVLTLEGDLDTDRLRRALEEAAGGHDALRVRFGILPGMTLPVQMTDASARVELRRLEPTNGGSATAFGAVAETGAADPGSPAVLRADLVPMDGRRHGLVLGTPALAADGASLEVLARQVAGLYAGAGPEDGGLAYVQLSEWLNEQLADPDEEGAEFWRRFGEHPPVLRLPFQRPGSPEMAYEPASRELELPPETVRGLRRVAGDLGVPLGAVLLGAWQALLGRLARQTDFWVAETFSGRDLEALAGAVGLLARAVPVPADLDPLQPFATFVGRLAEVREEVRQWGDLYLWGGDREDRAVSHPLAGFELQELPERWTAGDLVFSVERYASSFDRFGLRLVCGERGAALDCRLEYDAALFEARDVEGVAEHLRALTAGVVADPETPLDRLPLLSPESRRRTVARGRTPAVEGRGRGLLHERFLAWAEREPERPAVRFEETERSYGELASASARLARFLRERGVGPEEVVGLALERSVDLVTSMLAVLRAGGAYLVLDPAQPRRRLEHMLEDSRVAVVLTTAELQRRLPETAAGVVTLDEAWSAVEGTADDLPELAVAPESLAYVVFTSGSTGRPKGVGVEHRNLVAYLDGAVERLDLPEGAHYATVSTPAADLGNTMIFAALAAGGCLHVLSAERAGDPDAVAEYFRRHPIDCLKIVPSHVEALTGLADPASVLPRGRLVLGGELLRRALANRLVESAGGTRTFNHYGPSETTVGAAAFELTDAPADPRLGSVPIGRALPGAELHLLDPALEPVPDWVPGELFIGGDGVARGYLGRPGTTAERFVPDPHAERPGARLYRSGDLARRLPDGAVEFLGRADDQVKYHGFRVELGEIRSALCEHPDIRDSVVRVLRDDDRRQVLVAYYVGRQPLEVADLRGFLEGKLLDEIVPGFFCHLRRLPLGLNGKLNPEALPGLEEIKSRSRDGLEGPRDPIEEVLVGVWARVLGLEAVGIHDSFFNLGGHSLLATQLISRVRRLFEIEVPLRTLFEAPTVAAFARRVERALAAGETAAAPPIVPRESGPDARLSFAQERLWFMHRLDPESAAYNVPVALRLNGRLALPALARSVGELVRRHEILRTTFRLVGEEPRQRVLRPPTPSLPLADLSGLPESARQAEARRLSAAEAARPFDLAKGPVLRLTALRLGEREHAVLATLHHIVSDAWSTGVLVREVSALYRAFAAGEPSPLEPLPIQYADFAEWQRRWLDGEVLESHLSFWRRQLAGAPETLDLPTDRARTGEGSTAGAQVGVELSEETSKALRQLCRDEGATAFMCLLAGFQSLLAALTGRDDVVVGTDIANRNRVEGEELIGFFVNNLALRADLSGNPTFREVLRRVRRTTLDAYAHQDLPFELLVKELRPKRSLGRTPLFHVLFVYQNAPERTLELPGLEIRPMESGEMTSKFDLSLFLGERGGRFAGDWVYRTELFDRSTVARFSECFTALLDRAARNPDVRSSELADVVDTREERDTMETSDRRAAKVGKLRNVRRRSVDPTAGELVELKELEPGQAMPLVATAKLGGVDLPEWMAEHRESVDGRLLRHGAVLFRGFGIGSVDGFESVAQALCPDLFSDYGDLPKETEGEKVYRSTPYPPDKTILFHNESSHMHRWPARQMFFCAQAAKEGGETPILDCREVHRRLDPEILRPMEQKGLLYVRHFVEDLDVSWRQFFHTGDRNAVERFCEVAGIEYEWTDRGLKTRQRAPAVIRHPRTGDPVFFNQIQLHHPACLEPEERRSLIEHFGEGDLPRNVCYGDGTPIEDEVIERISALYRELAVTFPWQDGDVLVVDNMLVAHSRNPFVGPRKIVVAMADLVHQRDVEAA